MTEPARTRRPLSRGEWVALALAVVIVGATVALWVKPAWGPTGTAPVAAPAAGSDEPATTPGGPAPTATDEHVRELLAAASPDRTFRRWLNEADLVRRWVVTTDNLAEGVIPRRSLDFLAPARSFTVAVKDGTTVIAPAAFARYDGFADAVASIDPQVFARVYRELHGVLEASYRGLGYPGASLDQVTARAIRRIELAPVEEGDTALVEQGGAYAFAEPRLEQLGAVEKQLLRMGPRNTRIVQAKARDIRAALGLPVEIATQAR